MKRDPGNISNVITAEMLKQQNISENHCVTCLSVTLHFSNKTHTHLQNWEEKLSIFCSHINQLTVIIIDVSHN